MKKIRLERSIIADIREGKTFYLLLFKGAPVYGTSFRLGMASADLSSPSPPISLS